MPPEIVSTYSDRPIRPLPKRSLRERLSPEVVGSIKYPIAPRAKPPLFYHSYNLRDDHLLDFSSGSLSTSERKGFDELEKNYVSRRNDEDLADEEYEIAYSDWMFSRRPMDSSTAPYTYFQKLDSKSNNPQPPGSATSSADGYDSFENTNNKKKRKIPSLGESNPNGVRFSGEINGSSSLDDLEDLIHHSTNSLQGICGPGRGRYGRNRNGRSPFTIFSDTSSNWNISRMSKQRQSHWTSSRKPVTNYDIVCHLKLSNDITAEAAGIISRSIASANAEKSSVTYSQLKENTSLHQQTSRKSGPASTQFTFSCDTQVPGWPGPTSSLVHQNPISTRMSTIATQTNYNLSSNRGVAYSKESHTAQTYTSNDLKSSQDQTVPSKKSRRRAGKDYLITARQRRHQQWYRNYHNPVASEDVWICEFCEYERIFGTPPEALIRQYEIKDRRTRKQEAERKRLLEKAKMKGRKGKRGNKSTSKTTVNHDRQSQVQSHNSSNPSADKAQFQNQNCNNHSIEYIKDETLKNTQFAQDPPSDSLNLPPNL